MARSIGSIEVTVDADTGKLTAKLRKSGKVAGEAAKDAIDDELGDIGGRELTAALTRIRRQIERAVSGIEADIGADVDTASIRAAVERIEADVAEADTDANIGAEVDATQVTAALTRIRAAVGRANIDVEIGADVDMSEVVTAATTAAAQLDALAGPAGQAGTRAGRTFGGSLADSLGSLGGVAAAGVTVWAQPIAVALEGALGAATAVVASGFSAIAGAAGAAVPALAGVAGVAATLKIGLDGVSDALAGNEEALANLAPEAREFVDAMDDLRPAFDRIRTSVQERLFEGLSDQLIDLGDTVLPEVGEGLGDLADELNDFFGRLLDLAEAMDWEELFGTLETVVEDMLGGLLSLVNTFQMFVGLAAPAAERLAEGFADAAASLNVLVQTNPGALQEFLDGGLDSLGEWLELARSVGDALVTLFAAGKETGDSFVRSLAETIETFDTWMEGVAGQEALADFFNRAREVMEAMVPIGEGLVGFFDRIVTDEAVDQFAQITDIIGDLLPVLGTLFNVVGIVIGPFIDQIDVAAETLGFMAGVVEKVIPTLERLVVGIARIRDVAVLATSPLRLLAEGFGFVSDAAGRIVGLVDTGSGVVKGLATVAKDTTVAIDGVVDAEGRWGGVFRDSEAAMLDANAAVAAREAALQKERDAAFDAWEAELDLADSVREGAGEAAAATGFSEELADQLIDLGDAAHDAAEKADALRSAIDLLIAPAGDVEASFSALQEQIDSFDVLLQGGTEAIGLREEAMEHLAEADEAATEAARLLREGDEEGAARAAERAAVARDGAAAATEAADALERQAHSLDLTTEAGRANAELLREGATTTLEWAAGMLQAGESADVVTAKVAVSRETLEQQAEAFGLTGDQADAYVDTLLGTPELLNTLIETPGMAEALLNVDDLNVLYDSAGEPVYTEFAALGLSEEQANSEEFKTLLETLGLIHVAPTIDTSGAQVAAEDVKGIEDALGILDKTQAYPGTELEGDAQSDVDGLQRGLNTLDRTAATPRVTVQNIDPSITKVNQLDRAIRSLASKTVTITVNQRVTGQALPRGTSGLTPIFGGSMAGEIINHPTVREVGERGYREAIVPLDLPLSRVDPSVRELAALLRGDAAPSPTPPGGPRTVVNQSFTLASADPATVATQIMNRAAARAAFR